MSILYVTSDQVGVGKTAIAITFSQMMQRQGKSAIVVSEPDPSHVQDAVRSASEDADLVIVDAPKDASTELPNSLGAKVLMLTNSSPKEHLQSSVLKAKEFGNTLVGLIINNQKLYQGTYTKTNIVPDIAKLNIHLLGVIPENRKLLSVTVGQLAEHLNGRLLVHKDQTNELVEDFLVGGMGLDAGETYFNTKTEKAAIIRGDRPDIQMAALTTPTTCLILTNGISPIEYVINEATLEEIPIILVESNTIETMDSLNEIQSKALFDHPEKIRLFEKLIQTHVDLNDVYRELGLRS